jgi:hypothetical protein
MKLIEPTQKPVEKNFLQKSLDQLNHWLPFGKADEQFDENVIARFQRGLDSRFVMLHNLQLEPLNPPFPPILVGPTGLSVLNISKDKGFFKAKDSSWWKMDKTTHRFNPANPNLIKQSQEYAKKLATILDVHGKSHPEITPILIFADPGVHIETTTPAIRIVLMDGVDNLINGLLNTEEVLQPNEIRFLADSLEVMANPDKAIPMGEGEDFFGQDLYVPEKKAAPKIPSMSLPTQMPLPPVEEKLHFSRKQWIILAVLVIFTILILFGAIIFALSFV